MVAVWLGLSLSSHTVTAWVHLCDGRAEVLFSRSRRLSEALRYHTRVWGKQFMFERFVEHFQRTERYAFSLSSIVRVSV